MEMNEGEEMRRQISKQERDHRAANSKAILALNIKSHVTLSHSLIPFIVYSGSLSFPFVVRYLISLGQSMVTVIKNPRCTWECCIGVVLSVQETGADLGEIGETAAANDYKADLHHDDMVSIA